MSRRKKQNNIKKMFVMIYLLLSSHAAHLEVTEVNYHAVDAVAASASATFSALRVADSSVSQRG